MTQPFKLKINQPARKIMLKIFSKAIAYDLNTYNNPTGYEMPIQGGWGYTKDDAVIIDKYDPAIDQTIPFDGVKLEYIFARYRAYLEMITFRNDNERFSGIELELEVQTLINDETGIYDKLVFNIIALHSEDFDELKEEWETNCNLDDFDIVAHQKKREKKLVHLQNEYWFEISSFYGQ
jgi:hypothetical protein